MINSTQSNTPQLSTPPINNSSGSTSGVVEAADKALVSLGVSLTKTTPLPPPVAQLDEKARRMMIDAYLNRIILQLKTLIPATNFPHGNPLAILNIAEFCQLVATEVLLTLLDGEPPKQTHQTIMVAFSKTLQSGSLKGIKECFAPILAKMKADPDKKKQIEDLLKILDFFASKQNDYYSANLFEAPSIQEIKAFTLYTTSLQDKLLTRLTPLLKESETNLNLRLEGFQAEKKLMKAPSNAPNIVKETASVSRRFYETMGKFTGQVVLYTSIIRERVKSAYFHAKENDDDEFFLTNLTKKREICESLWKKKTLYLDTFESFLKAYLVERALNTGFNISDPHVDKKLETLLRARLTCSAEHLKTLAEKVKGYPITTTEFSIMMINIHDDILYSYGQLSQRPITGDVRHPLHADLVHITKGHIQKFTELCLSIQCSGQKDLEKFKCANNSELMAGSCEGRKLIFQQLLIDQSLNKAEVELNKVAKEVARDAVGDIRGLKVDYLKNIQHWQIELYGSQEKADLINGDLHSSTECMLESLDNVKAYAALLIHFSPLFVKFHNCLSNRIPIKNFDTLTEALLSFEEQEPPRVQKNKNTTASHSTAKKKSTTNTPAPVASPETTSTVKSPSKVGCGEVFSLAKHLLLGSKPVHFLKADPLELYHVDALYHFFHLVTLLEMMQNSRADHARLFLSQVGDCIHHLEEQVVTPIYTQQVDVVEVTHNLSVMCRNLKIQTPFSCNGANVGFRYPHALAASSAKYKLNSTDWLQEMVGKEISPQEMHQKALKRSRIAIDFVSTLLKSNQLKEIWPQFLENRNEVQLNSQAPVANAQVEAVINKLDQIDLLIATMKNPELLPIWADLKVHAYRFKQAEELLRTNPKQSCLSIYAKTIVMSSQYFVEHFGQLMALLIDKQPLRTHRLDYYAALQGWNTLLNASQLDTLQRINIQKGADYLHWTLWNKKGSVTAPTLDLLHKAYEVSVQGAENGEGFQTARKQHTSAEDVKTELSQLVDKATDLMNECAKLLLDRVNLDN